MALLGVHLALSFFRVSGTGHPCVLRLRAISSAKVLKSMVFWHVYPRGTLSTFGNCGTFRKFDAKGTLSTPHCPEAMLELDAFFFLCFLAAAESSMLISSEG